MSLTTSSTLIFDPITLGASTGQQPLAAPRGLVATRAVETIDGWVGQVIVDGEIIKEFSPVYSVDRATSQATRHVVKAFRKLLAK